MDKFETLEDYQNSLKEFNERTRKSYENFIQEHGDDSQKLQLRCTPYTEKKGRYGVASLDFGFQIWQSRQAEVDALNDNHLAYIDKVIAMESDYLEKIEEKDKRIEELERSCISYKNQRDDNAQKLMVKSVHYSSIQEELAKLKDRLELAHHLATQSTWSSLKQLKKVVKALRGEHE